VTPAAEALIRSATAALGDALIAALAEEDGGPTPDRLLSVDAAAEALGVGRSLAYDLIGAARLRSVRVGRRRLIPSSAISEYVQRESAR